MGTNQYACTLTWPGKQESAAAARTPPVGTLYPCPEESVDFDTTENLYIEGDNLEALKLLRDRYAGAVKMIYIDPPYNTGNDFVYRDRFADGPEAGAAWLNLIYPRLLAARELLAEDGVIFVSIDDHELDHLLILLDEVFGRRNRAGIIVVRSNPRGSMSTGPIAKQHEYLLVYCRERAAAALTGHPLTEAMRAEYRFRDERGNYRLLGLRMRGGFWRRSQRPNLFFPIYVNPADGSVSPEPGGDYREPVLPLQPSSGEEGTWRWSRDKVAARGAELIGKQVRRGAGLAWDIYQKDYCAGSRRTKARSIWEEAELNYQNGAAELRALFGAGGLFDYAKPTFLIRRAMDMVALSEGDIVLDFFSGAATTGHAVMLHAAGGGARCRFLLVQLPEETPRRSVAYRAGYRTVSEIGKERLRRAGARIQAEAAAEGREIDTGFRVLKLN